MTYSPATILLRLPEVLRMTGLGKTTLYGLIKTGSFPAPVPLGGRAVAWASQEVEGWIADRLKAAGREVA